jgi:hypothetical protein
MSWPYYLISFLIIVLTALVYYFRMKKKNQVNKESLLNLGICSAIAMVCVALAPYLGKFFVLEFNIPVLVSIVLSFVVFMFVAIIAFNVISSAVKISEDKMPSQSPDINIKEKAGDDFTISVEYDSIAKNLVIPPERDYTYAAAEDSTMATEGAAAEAEEAAAAAEEPAAVTEEATAEDAATEGAAATAEKVAAESAASEEEDAVTEGAEVAAEDAKTVDAAAQKQAAVSPDTTEPFVDITVQSTEQSTEQSIAQSTVQSTVQSVEQSAAQSEVLYDFNSLSLIELINLASDLKENRDYEGAVLAFKGALGKYPDKDLLTWILIDLCALYKIIGQKESVQEILDLYIGEGIDLSIKEEILRNL